MARCYSYFLNKSFPVKAWSVLQSNWFQTRNLFPPESHLCGSQGHDGEQGAESLYSIYQNRLTQNIYHAQQKLIS